MKILIKSYQYIFYKLYCFAYRLNDGGDLPCQTAMHLIGILMWVNFLSIVIPLLDLVFGMKAGDKIISTTTSLVIFAVIFFIIHDHIFYKIVDCKKIVKKFKNESNSSRIKGNFFVTTYVIGTVFFLIFFTILSKYIGETDFSLVNYFHSFFWH